MSISSSGTSPTPHFPRNRYLGSIKLINSKNLKARTRICGAKTGHGATVIDICSVNYRFNFRGLTFENGIKYHEYSNTSEFISRHFSPWCSLLDAPQKGPFIHSRYHSLTCVTYFSSSVIPGLYLAILGLGGSRSVITSASPDVALALPSLKGNLVWAQLSRPIPIPGCIMVRQRQARITMTPSSTMN